MPLWKCAACGDDKTIPPIGLLQVSERAVLVVRFGHIHDQERPSSPIA